MVLVVEEACNLLRGEGQQLLSNFQHFPFDLPFEQRGEFKRVASREQNGQCRRSERDEMIQHTQRRRRLVQQMCVVEDQE